MKYVILGVFVSLLFIQCKNDKAQTEVVAHATEVAESEDKAEAKPEVVMSNELYAKIDRLKIRTDSTMGSRTSTVISEGDTLLYMGTFSDQRENLKLRGRHYHAPWLKVNHPKSGKNGWVYGGAVKYDDPQLESKVQKASMLMRQVYADDLEWDGNVPSSWSKASFSNAADFKIFLIRFKEQVANGEIDQLAELIKYPIKNINSRSEFKDYYSRIFSEEMKAAIADQRLDRIFRNAQGAIIGNGDMHFMEVGGEYKIVRVNFKGREDIKRELMKSLSHTYVGSRTDEKYSIKAYMIKQFLELTLNYQSNGYPQSKSLGRYLFESSQAGIHTFKQDTRDSIKAQLLFKQDGDNINLHVNGLVNPTLEDVQFSKVE